MAGFKFIRPDEERQAEEGEAGEPAAAVPATDEKDEMQTLFFWFFFLQASGRVAWEATTGSGRATYFFDVAAPLDRRHAKARATGCDSHSGKRFNNLFTR